MERKERGVCKFFAKSGFCKKGPKCEFQHVGGGGGSDSGNWRGPKTGSDSYPKNPSHDNYSHSSSPFDHGRGGFRGGRGGRGGRGDRGGYGGHDQPRYCREYHRGNCMDLRHGDSHNFPPGIDRKSILTANQGDQAGEIVGFFNFSETEYCACTNKGIISVWNMSFSLVNGLSLNIPCSTATCFTTPSGPFLVFGTYFQSNPKSNQYGIYATNGTNSVSFPVFLIFMLG